MIGAGDASRGRILVVDDWPTIAESVSRYLGRGGYETRIATDGHAALARASTWHPDLVVLDLMLPGLDGSWPPTRARASRRATASGSSRPGCRSRVADGRQRRLGLAVSRAIVEAHGGRTWIVGEAGDDDEAGACVRLSLPGASTAPLAA